MPLTAWDIAAVIAKAVTYAATLSAAGGMCFLAYSHDLLDVLETRRIKRLVMLLGLVAIVISCLRIAILTGSMSGELSGMVDGELASVLLGAGEGRATGLRIAGLVLAGVAVFSQRRPSALALLGASMAAVSFAAIGHVHAVAAASLSIGLLGIHLLCVAFWLGALPPLLFVAQSDDVRHIAAAASRFGHIAVGMVAALIATGATVLYVLVGSISALWNSGYGQAILLKLGLVSCLLGLAALNKLRITPRLRAGDSTAVRRLRRSIRVEMLLAALILLVTATFTTITGPPSVGSEFLGNRQPRRNGFERMRMNIRDAGGGLALQAIDVPELCRIRLLVGDVVHT